MAQDRRLRPCYYCGTECVPTKDHVIPLALAGSDERWNRVDSCGPCNSTKGRQTYEKFTGKTRLPDRVIAATGCVTTTEWVNRATALGLYPPVTRVERFAQRRKLNKVQSHPAWVASPHGPRPKGGW